MDIAGAISGISSARGATGVVVNTATLEECRAIYVGVTEQFDFNIGGSWIPFGGLQAGTILPIKATGTRDSGDAAPGAGEIVFLY